MADTPGQQLIDMWRKQIEEGTQSWLKMFGQGQAVDPQSFWRPFMDPSMAAWSKVMTQGATSPDLMAQWKQFLDQWIAAWAKALEQAMNTDAFARAMGKQLEGFLDSAGPAKKSVDQGVEAGLAALGIPSRTQVTSLAGQIVQLEDKIERLEDRLDEVLRRLTEMRPRADAPRA